MRIKSITIENFKAFKKVKIDFNEKFNFIVGENNIGKSTIFEAIHLWKIAYEAIIVNKGDNFYGENTNRYLPVDSLYFLRLQAIKDIFHSSNQKLSVSLEIAHEDEAFPLKISLEKPSSIDTYFRIKFKEKHFISFKEKVTILGLNLRNVVFVYQSSPIFHSIKNEPFYNNAQLLKKISLGKSHEVIRNKILKCESNNKFDLIESRLNSVFNTKLKLRFKNKNRQDDEFVRITIQEENKKEVDISLVGSGVLQVLEIFSTLEFIYRTEHSLNILLIDEPDSHIHSNLQSSLIDELKKDEKNQIFLISHNDRLVSKAEEGELFFVNKAGVEKGVISSLPKNSYNTVASDLAGNLLYLSEQNKDKIIVITEGKTDKIILETAWSKLNPIKECPFFFISSGLNLDEEKRSGNADTVRRTIEMISTVVDDIKLIGLFDNDRAGNEQYKGVNKNVFELYDIAKSNRKHLTKDIYALLLLPPESRSIFVTERDMLQRYFVIEHYFSDEILERFGMKGSSILGSEVFEIKGNKDSFSNDIELLEANEFENFRILFNKMQELFEERSL